MEFNTSAVDSKISNQNVHKPYCVGEATVSLVHMLGQHPLLPSDSKPDSESNEESAAYCNDGVITNCGLYTQDFKEFEGKRSITIINYRANHIFPTLLSIVYSIFCVKNQSFLDPEQERSDCTASKNKSKSEVSIACMESQYNGKLKFCSLVSTLCCK